MGLCKIQVGFQWLFEGSHQVLKGQLIEIQSHCLITGISFGELQELSLHIRPIGWHRSTDQAPHPSSARAMQCDARAVLTWALALCPAAIAAATTGKLASARDLTWDEASELLYFLPFVLFRFPDNKGAGLLAIVASSLQPPPQATAPKDSPGIPNNDNTTNSSSTTTAKPTHLAVKNRFARSFSQLVASQLVPGDLITMAKSQGILTNMGVDYVVVFRFATTGE